MLSEDVDETVAPPLDNPDCDEGKLDDDQLFWRRNGYIIKEDFIPDELIDRYCEIRQRVPAAGGWKCPAQPQGADVPKPEERNHLNWAGIAERFVNDIAQEEIGRRGLKPKKFIAKKGDVLVWHGKLMHRGSYPNVQGMQRKTLISHYSGISHRIDMPDVARTAEGSAFFQLNLPLDFDPYADQVVAAE